MLLKQKIKLRNALVSFANKLKIFKIIQENLAIIDFSKTLIVLEKRVKYKLLQLLKVATIATINSNKKTNNNSALIK